MPRLLACAVVLAALLVAPAAAGAKGPVKGCVKTAERGTVQRLQCTTQPITVSGYEVKQNGVSAEWLGVPKPTIDGHITAMDVDVVDASGRPIPINRLMLHHIVFANLGARLGTKFDGTCSTFTALDNRSTIPAVAERFYGAGEERAKLDLPAGYGYPSKGADQWFMTWMFMNHRRQADTGWIRYGITIDTAPRITPVKPYWLDVRNCLADPIFNVPGGGRHGGTWTETAAWRVPVSGRIVAAGGHVHGGAKRVVARQPDCGGRELYRSEPAWGTRSHPYYNVEPVLHEPGPIATSWMRSASGLPVAAGERVTLSADYDAELPHTRAMGISLLFLAPDENVKQPCGAIPADRSYGTTTLPHRTSPPRFTVPLTGLDDDGRAVAVERPPGTPRRLASGSTVRVSRFAFSTPNVVLSPGATLRWHFPDAELHNVTLASGPRGFGSPHLNGGRSFAQRFTKPGTYKLFCGLHPVSITGTVTVRKAR